jgi:hypothetical protein
MIRVSPALRVSAAVSLSLSLSLFKFSFRACLYYCSTYYKAVRVGGGG